MVDDSKVILASGNSPVAVRSIRELLRPVDAGNGEFGTLHLHGEVQFFQAHVLEPFNEWNNYSFGSLHIPKVPACQ